MIVKNIYAAQSIGDEEQREAVIRIGPSPFPRQGFDRSAKLSASEAKALAAVLREALPGGTFDRLVCEMLAMKASHFVVSHCDVEGES